MYSKRQRCYLATICNCASTAERKKLIKILPPDVVRILTEIIKNLFAGNIVLSSKNHKRLGRFSSVLENINHNKTVKHRHNLLLQRGGGFIPILLPLISGIIGGLL